MIRLVTRLLELPLVVHDESAGRQLDAIVVLGAPLTDDDRLTAPLRERVDAAVALWRAGGAPVVVATGGTTHGGRRAEADAMAEALHAAGVDRVVVENRSRTTRENATFTAALLPPGASVWIVTQPFHGRRAARLFRSAGFDAHVWHIANSIEYRDRVRAARWVVREYAAWAALLLRRHER